MRNEEVLNSLFSFLIYAGSSRKKKDKRKSASNTEQNHQRLFERRRSVCILHAPLDPIRNRVRNRPSLSNVISHKGSCPRSYLLLTDHTSPPVRYFTENRRGAAMRRDLNFLFCFSPCPPLEPFALIPLVSCMVTQ